MGDIKEDLKQNGDLDYIYRLENPVLENSVFVKLGSVDSMQSQSCFKTPWVDSKIIQKGKNSQDTFEDQDRKASSLSR